MKDVAKLSVRDFARYPVWGYADDDTGSDTSVEPVSPLPVSSLMSRLVGTKVKLANGSEVWGLLGNINTKNERRNKHFATLVVYNGKRSFRLARYHDCDYGQRGPKELAAFLHLDVDDVFPIKYDLRPFANGPRDALQGTIEKEPSERLTRSEIIAMAVPLPDDVS